MHKYNTTLAWRPLWWWSIKASSVPRLLTIFPFAGTYRGARLECIRSLDEEGHSQGCHEQRSRGRPASKTNKHLAWPASEAPINFLSRHLHLVELRPVHVSTNAGHTNNSPFTFGSTLVSLVWMCRRAIHLTISFRCFSFFFSVFSVWPKYVNSWPDIQS